MIDQNRDGFIDQADLQEMFASLGNYLNCFGFENERRVS